MKSKERYERCKIEHRCPNCFNKHDGKFLYCDKCREWRKRYNPGRTCMDCGIKIEQGKKDKRCEPCKEKHMKKYYKSWANNLSPEKKDGYKKRLREYAKEWRRKHPEQYQDAILKRRYNITYFAAQELYEHQDGKCAICECEIPKITDVTKNRNTWAHIDHNHTTGKVRGLLCPHCNYLLGNCKEDPTILQRAISYLSNHSL